MPAVFSIYIYQLSFPEAIMQRTISAWVSQASHLIGDCFDIAKPYLDRDFPGLPAQIRFVVAQLFIDCHLSSESSLLLLREGKEWDADLVGRAVMEGSLVRLHAPWLGAGD